MYTKWHSVSQAVAVAEKSPNHCAQGDLSKINLGNGNMCKQKKNDK